VGGGSTSDFICSILPPNLAAAIDGVLKKARRRLNRVTVAGDIPVGIDGQKSYSVTGDASHYTPVANGRAAA
jgi:taurine dioxygenase